MSKTVQFILTVCLIMVIGGVAVWVGGNKGSNKLSDDANEAVNDGGTVRGVSADEPQPIYAKLSVIQAKDMVNSRKNDDRFVILDIRTNQELKSGRIEGAVNIDFYGDFEPEVAKLDRSKTYLIYCRSGNRTSQAMFVFEKLGFKEVYDLEGGYNAWQAMSIN